MLKRTENRSTLNVSILIVIPVWFMTVKKWKQFKCLSTNLWINKMWCIYMVEFYLLFSHKKNLIIFSCHVFILLDMDLKNLGKGLNFSFTFFYWHLEMFLYRCVSVRALWLLIVETDSSNLSKRVVCWKYIVKLTQLTGKIWAAKFWKGEKLGQLQVSEKSPILFFKEVQKKLVF